MAASRRWAGALAGVWERVALLGILALSTALNVVGLDREAYANTYYAAAVKSMLTGWRAFFFASFDAGGFVTVDKPPLGLWVQAASAKLFGFNGLSLLLPQAIAGVLAVALLYWLVRRAYGTAAGLVAALALAVTPIAVVTNRNNTMDSQLVLVLLLAAWAATLAAERGRLRPLLLCAALVGLAYNIKMLQAYLVVPALWGVYLLCVPLRLRDRLVHLTLATVVLLGVSLSWSAMVDLMPSSERPYIGSSGSNSALSLALGYNGLGRLTTAIASRLPIPWLDGLTVDLTAAPGFAPGIGSPGLLRLFGDGLAGQASWLLPLALLGLLVAAQQLLPRPRWRRPLTTQPPLPTHTNPSLRSGQAGAPPLRGIPVSGEGASDDRDHERRQRVALVLWGLWLAACAGYFSVARFYHIYYLIMLGPGVAALAGLGVAACWRGYRQGGWCVWLLPFGLLVTAGVQARMLAAYPAWSGWLSPLVLGGCGVAALVLIALRVLGRQRTGGRLVRVTAVVAAGVGCLTLLATPTVWAGISVQNNNGAAWLPRAGPSTGFGPGGRMGGPRFDGGAPPGLDGGGPRGGPAGFVGGPAGGPRASFGGPGAGPGGQRGGQMAMTFAGDQWNSLDPGLVQYLLTNQGSATFLVATPTSSYASLFILATDQPALALGGYQGWDRILTPDRLAELVADGTVRFFWMNGDGGPGNAPGAGSGNASVAGDGQVPTSSSQDATVDLVAWVRASCVAVSPDQWQDVRGQQLYDCGELVSQR